MLGVTVQSGTGAGRRRVKQRDRWQCHCLLTHSGDRYSCPFCGARRP